MHRLGDRVLDAPAGGQMVAHLLGNVVGETKQPLRALFGHFSDSRGAGAGFGGSAAARAFGASHTAITEG